MEARYLTDHLADDVYGLLKLFRGGLCWHGFMKVDLRISIKDYRRNKNFKIQLTQVPFARRASFGCG
jgi:hypothetical protein